eukprot:CAMPEP_0202890800 /NCGR_PEP_ID=MMETSP1392-20130828/1096_1 /ASSEMBLY_ACC=CAM_ASM_000868 /TAXON_ID=225041 /ORGANISM="Chlamydomonas chlamydogama, Strain SAG 11-48b" /LENGTH=41 /DNA_ID= /DNA_START= /DNA_END= /DNA_ORIENTATION=
MRQALHAAGPSCDRPLMRQAAHAAGPSCWSALLAVFEACRN